MSTPTSGTSTPSGAGNSIAIGPNYDHSHDHQDDHVQRKLQHSLFDIERTGGMVGWAASKFLSAGDWIERELEERRQTIGGIDNLFLLLPDATDFNPVCACVFTMRGKVPLGSLQHATIRLQRKFPRYRQRLTSIGRVFHGARFVDDPHFDIRNHVHSVTLPGPAGKRELDKLMGEFIAQDWDMAKPLWEMILVENYRDDEGAECAIISRGHHALADGQGFTISQLYMTSYYQDILDAMYRTSDAVREHHRAVITPSKVHPFLRPLDRFTDPTTSVFLAPFIHLVLQSLFWFTYSWTFGISLVITLYQGLVQLFLFAMTCWRVDMLTSPQPSTRVKTREFSRSDPVKLEDIRLIQQAFSGKWPGSAVHEPGGRSKVGHVTLNDVMCAIMADTCATEIGARLEREKERQSVWETRGLKSVAKGVLRKVLPSPLGFFIPISVRRVNDFSMRNLSTGSLVYLYPSSSHSGPSSSFPEKVRMLHKHIHACRSSLSLLKHSLIPRLFFYTTQAMAGQVPVLWPVPFGLFTAKGKGGGKSWNLLREWAIKPLLAGVMESFPILVTKYLVSSCNVLSNHSVFLDSVPGPSKRRIILEGVEVINWTALPPQGGKGTVGIGLISYASQIFISIAADRIPGSPSDGVARRICEAFEQRFAEYVELAKEVIKTEQKKIKKQRQRI